MMDSVSRYAAVDADEWFAECFAEMVESESPRAMAQEFKEYFRRVDMIGLEPNFMSSPFFVCEPDNWHLKPGAPEDVKKQFDAFMKSHELNNRRKLSVTKTNSKSA